MATLSTSNSSNYWNDWLIPDSNSDNIVDLPYTSDGALANPDESPQVYAYLNKDIHILTQPTLLFPNESLDSGYYYGLMTITWTPSSDTFGHEVRYSLHCTIGESDTWELIESDISTTWHSWNTSAVLQDRKYSLRITAQCNEELTRAYATNASFTIREHTLSAPIIFDPIDRQLVASTMNIKWEPAIDSWNHNVLYSVFYALEGSNEWVTIEEELESTTYRFYFPNFPDGTYMVRVRAFDESRLISNWSSEVTIVVVQILDELTGITVSVTLVLSLLVIVVYFLKKRFRES
ncbi:MAG: fibronectin type III domain-containing protein [Candidatus Thorarchaeota archaeon]|nr:fibronectin type III domain-containing protein [Candidatus Thorarchaeota archaeon]